MNGHWNTPRVRMPRTRRGDIPKRILAFTHSTMSTSSDLSIAASNLSVEMDSAPPSPLPRAAPTWPPTPFRLDRNLQARRYWGLPLHTRPVLTTPGRSPSPRRTHVPSRVTEPTRRRHEARGRQQRQHMLSPPPQRGHAAQQRPRPRSRERNARRQAQTGRHRRTSRSPRREPRSQVPGHGRITGRRTPSPTIQTALRAVETAMGLLRAALQTRNAPDRTTVQSPAPPVPATDGSAARPPQTSGAGGRKSQWCLMCRYLERGTNLARHYRRNHGGLPQFRPIGVAGHADTTSAPVEYYRGFRGVDWGWTGHAPPTATLQ